MDVYKFLKTNFANIVSLSTVPFALGSFYYIFQGDFFLSVLLINIAFFLDTLDGYFARKFKIESEIGKLIDSLCDVINYLIFPALFIFKFFDFDLATKLIVTSFIVIFGVTRLARFTNEGFSAKEGKEGNKYYRGIPVPIALYGTIFFYCIHMRWTGIDYFFPAIMIIFSLLMVSSIKVKKVNNAYWYILVLVGLLILSMQK